MPSVMLSDTNNNNLSLSKNVTLTDTAAPKDYIVAVAAKLWPPAEVIYWADSESLASMNFKYWNFL